jgi:hypothetical protein
MIREVQTDPGKEDAMKRLLLAGFSMVMLLAFQAQAAPISMLALVGEAPKGTDVSLLWKGETMADGVADKSRHFELDVPMGADMPYHAGDKLEIDINGKPNGQKIVLGRGNRPEHIVLLGAKR